MDTPTRYSVTSLVNQRSAGLISSIDFFERLADLEFSGPEPTVPSSSRGGVPVAWHEGVPYQESSTFAYSSTSAISPDLPQVLTESEADALLRRPKKDRQAHDQTLPSAGVARRPVEAAEGHSAETLGVPPLLTEQEATALAHEMCARGSSLSPRNLAADLPWPSPVSPDGVDFHSSLPFWSSSSCARYDELRLNRSASSDGLSSPQKSSVSSFTRSCSSSASAFSQRLEMWEFRRAQKREDLRRQRDAREIAECSFRPTVNRVTARSTESTGCTGDTPTVARLSAPPPSAARHSQAARRWQEQREKEEMRECTFIPDCSRSSSSIHLSVRSLNSSLSESIGGRGDEDCIHRSLSARKTPRASSSGGQNRKGIRPAHSFTPSTNPVPLHMVGAQTYTRQNVFSRLSEYHADALDSQCASEALSSKAQAGSRDNSQASEPSKSRQHAQEDFYDFLQRQNDFEDERRRRISEVERFTTPVGRPVLCSHSRKLARHRKSREEEMQSQRATSPVADMELRTGISAKGSLSARGKLAAHSLTDGQLFAIRDSGTGGTSSARGGSSGTPSSKKKAEASSSPGHSFQPSISAVASRRPARTSAEMSSGDLRRREAHVAEMRAERRREVDEQLPFTPQLCDSRVPVSVRKVESKLKLLEEPETYVERMAAERTRKDLERQQALEEKAKEELTECTFSPQVQKGAPSFVQQMAKAHRSARSFLQETGVADKSQCSLPEWR
mmetsp:Transcript_68023/g.106348  ORF Transcript_68023/g.106348 Transcript_68023/m.106348 type:complete len:731 (+) Transcript_68023:22-2214(+)